MWPSKNISLNLIWGLPPEGSILTPSAVVCSVDSTLPFIWIPPCLPLVFLTCFTLLSPLHRCPAGHLTKESPLGKVCVYTLCASRPCRHGTCVAHSPSRYTCQCTEGYRGRHCEVTLAMFHEDGNSLSLSSMFAISICVLAFLGSYVDYVIFYLW